MFINNNYIKLFFFKICRKKLAISIRKVIFSRNKLLIKTLILYHSIEHYEKVLNFFDYIVYVI